MVTHGLAAVIEYLMKLVRLFRQPSVTVSAPVVATVIEPQHSIEEVVLEPVTASVEIKTEPVKMSHSFIKSIHQLPLDRDEFLAEAFEKKQIYLHHTAGGPSARQVVKSWNNDDRGRIATCVVISNTGAKDSVDGEIVQAFSSKFWGYHLGVKSAHFKNIKLPYIGLDQHSIGIELCAWGPLTVKGNKFYNYVNREVPAAEVCKLDKPFKGYQHYHRYSTAQIEAVKNLLIYWNEVYGIPLAYNEDIWAVTKRAYKLEAGVFTHNSVRPDKTDVFPQPELIEMLKSLRNI